MKALILAAGLGTRLRPYTNHTPKPLFTIAGRPLLDMIIDNLKRAGCEAVMINTHHIHRNIETFVAERSYGIPVSTRYEPQILGTGGAIKNVADFWDQRPFMVINADIVADIDLAAVYQTHCLEGPPATLVLCNDPAFNSVAVEKNKWIKGFRNRQQIVEPAGRDLLTFTGIQVLDPLILEYIPDNSIYSSIDAFKKMLAEGKNLQAYVVPDGKWQDIGTPERYRRAAWEAAVPRAFQAAFGKISDLALEKQKLKGDGSERHWYRLKSGEYTLILADHGIRVQRSVSEVDAFVHIGQHLHRQGVPVPEIFFYDPFSGLVFLTDLGDINLQEAAGSAANPQALVRLYKTVIDQLVKLSLRGADNFNPAWTYQSANYDRELIIEKECRYFQEAFLKDYLGLPTRFEDLAREFESLARKALQYAQTGFMHRDMQSRNIMVKNHQIYFIDFQGGRFGPIQYDLASLLIDPYVQLPPAIREQLLDYSIEVLSRQTTVERKKFDRCFSYCCLTRNLQILGAFAYLSKVKGKRYFEAYIPAAMQSLISQLQARSGNEFPALTATVVKAHNRLQKADRPS
jgi:aminoglycoside/choline kinase family phosphotransferase/GTP:adenosylcobinamide-phosphate guanylyltransferase